VPEINKNVENKNFEETKELVPVLKDVIKKNNSEKVKISDIEIKNNSKGKEIIINQTIEKEKGEILIESKSLLTKKMSRK